ncbi:MAG: substrate-binding domain-containing protein [Gammaproteobacteria bacterium]|jgi:autoinducer 2-binding protein LuxP|nr:substrate-binding domain-containing protein [Gammaproteobacteria bacterium]MBT3488972.1 substrate-binding domain-containing protein [Gammaproteobacteria bacterium]MBT3844727.1 substrate-binding domain-containing protein [Gammaproteobacteria bacterium]MBT3892647.1 substrate-binding domain-containing protein [Gammaproteobacteria bacterium]MBT4300186.1 substrate-binding domain-containing protein [Gammaproteobacteria bacterium]
MVTKRLITRAVTLSLALLLAYSSLANGEQDYILIGEYLEKYPQQHQKMKQLSEMVRGLVPAVAVMGDKQVKIAIIYPGIQASDYWRRSVASFKARLDQSGLDYVLDTYLTKPTIEIRKQAEHLANALKKNPDYLIFTLDARRHKMMIERILAQKKPKLILQNITTPLAEWGADQPFLYVGFDHVIGSRKLASWYREQTGGAGDYAVVCWNRSYISKMRGEPFVSAINQHPDLSLKVFYYAGSTREMGQKAAQQALQEFPTLKFIYTCSTDLALGVADAIKQSGRTEVMVNGWGGGSAELDAIADGELDVTVMRMNDDNGVAMADAILMDLSGKGEGVPTIYSGDFEMVTAAMEKERVEQLKQRAFRYSGQ